MKTKALAVLTAAVSAGVVTAVVPWAAAKTTAHRGYEPVLNPKDFVRVIDNPYYPLPVGRTLIYRVHVTSGTKVLEGITATTVTDVARHNGKLLEKTTDWYGQDKKGNVWYLGENTAAF